MVSPRAISVGFGSVLVKKKPRFRFGFWNITRMHSFSALKMAKASHLYHVYDESEVITKK